MTGCASWTSSSSPCAAEKHAFAQRYAGVLAPVRLDGVDGAPEDGLGVVERAPATRPLRALPGEHHREAPLALLRGGDRGALLGNGIEPLFELVEVEHRKRGARGEMGATAAEIAGQRVEVHRPLGEHLAKPARGAGERLRVARGQGNDVAGVRSEGDGPHARTRRAVLAQHAVPVGASEAEGVDADDDGMLGEGLDFRLHPHRAAVEVDLGIRHQVVLRHRREGAPLHHQDDLQHRAMEGGRFHVPDVALDARDPERHLAIGPRERLRDGVALDQIAHHGARRVGLEVVELPGGASGARGGGAHQLDLGVARRRGDVPARCKADGVVGRAGGVDRARLDHRMNGIAVALGRRERLQREDEGAFGTHVAVGLGVEGVALALRADDPQEVEAAAQPGAAQVGDGADERLVAVAAAQRVHRRVQRAQARGAGGAVRDRGPHEVEVVRDPVGQHRDADAGDGVLADAVQGPPVGHGRELGSDEDPGGAVAQRMKVPAGVLDGLPRAVQQHPHLRLGLHHLVVGHAEQGTVEEQLVVVADQSFPGAREAARARELTDGAVTLSVAIDDRLAHDLPFAEQAPEIRIRPDAARHAVAVARDGNRVGEFLWFQWFQCVPSFWCPVGVCRSTRRQGAHSLPTRAAPRLQGLRAP